MPQVLKEDPAVKHALQCRTFVMGGDYIGLFRLYNSVPNLGGYLFDAFALRERRRAFRVMLVAYQSIPQRHVIDVLAFYGNEWAEFEKDNHIVYSAKHKSEPTIDCKLTAQKRLENRDED
eukprot:Awhi_evm1s8820